MTDDGSKYRRPHYQAGDHVRVLISGPSWKVADAAEVLRVDRLQTVDGWLAEYLYTLQFANLVRIRLFEQQIAPLGTDA